MEERLGFAVGTFDACRQGVADMILAEVERLSRSTNRTATRTTPTEDDYIGTARAMSRAMPGFCYDPEREDVDTVRRRLGGWQSRQLPFLTVSDICRLAQCSAAHAENLGAFLRK